MDLSEEFAVDRIVKNCAGTCPIGNMFHSLYSETQKERKKNANHRKLLTKLMDKIEKLEKQIEQLKGGSK